MKKYLCLPFLAIIFIPFCANRSTPKPMSISRSEISASVERDCLICLIERKLNRLEHPDSTKKINHSAVIVPIRASDAVHHK